MILLFGSKASRTASSNKNSNVKNHPVENSGILAMGSNGVRSLLTVAEHDSYTFSNPVAVDYSMYSDFSDNSEGGDYSGFMGAFSSAVATLGDCGFSSASSDCGFSSGSSCESSCSSSSFSSFC